MVAAAVAQEERIALACALAAHPLPLVTLTSIDSSIASAGAAAAVGGIAAGIAAALTKLVQLQRRLHWLLL